MSYERTSAIERASSDAPGTISGILVSDGEASDGHILNIDGVRFPDQAPLLFGHDDYTGSGNLGSWESFEKVDHGKGRAIRGTAKIDLDGPKSAQQDWRSDISYMVERGHISQLSVRWDEIGEPVRRVNLPSDHPAYVDSSKATGREAWGYYFDKWKLLEGSVVTLGADPAALIGRMQDSAGDVRGYWRSAINHALTEREEVAGLVAVALPTGDCAYVERPVYEAMLEEANARLQTVLDLHEELHEETLLHAIGADRVSEPTGKVDVPEKEEPNGSKRSAEIIDTAGKVDVPVTVESLVAVFTEALEGSNERLHSGARKLIDAATGRIG
jgi:hypothetical protein